MKKTFLRLLAAAMTLALMLPMVPAAHAADIGYPATAAVQQSIEQQIRAYAKSINRSGADDDAATALALHGIGGGGKTMTVGANHSLTATLMNSEQAQRLLIDSCEAAIRSMQQLDLDRLEHVRGHIHWGGTVDSFSFMHVYSSADQPREAYDWALCTTSGAEKWNGYDESLTWMVGGAPEVMSFKRTKITADTVTYQVNLEFKDRFDFSLSSSDGFKNLISGMGALLFREFDWSAKVTFDLTVPYTCHHESQNYRFTYDAESGAMTADASGSWQANDVTRRIYTSNGTDSYYYELAETVRLRHNAPWVMEFDARTPNSFGLSPLSGPNYVYPVLHKNARAFLYVSDYEWMKVSQNIKDEYGLTSDFQQTRHYYGTSLNDRFNYSESKTYTFRLENELRADGSNMIYLTVSDTDTGRVVLDRTPMDDHYYYENWTMERTLIDENNAWVSGKDLLINYIGYRESRFTASHFELRVWENGIGGDSCSYITDKVVKPTCTARGYVQHTCTLCGYSYHTDYVAAKGHQFGAYADNNNATCTTDGTKTAKCSTCGAKDTVSIPGSAKGHQFGAYADDNNTTCTTDGTKTATCAACGVTDTVTIVGSAPGHSFIHQTVPPSASSGGYTRHTCTVCKYYYTDGFTDPLTGTKGDFTGDKKVTDEDAIYLLWHTLFPGNYPLSTSGDLTGDGKVTDEDAVYLLWHTLFPTRYPLGR